jgi:hypothetical protein
MTNKVDSNRSTKHEKRQCEAILKSGQRCRAWAVRGGVYCSLHDPRNATKVKEGRKRGGRMPRAKVLAKELKEIRSFEDLLDFLNRLIKDTYTGAITAKQSQAVTTALSGIRVTIQDLMSAGGEAGYPRKLYDFKPPGYDETLKRIMADPRGREALEVLNRLTEGEGLPVLPEKLPPPHPEIEAGEANEQEEAQDIIEAEAEDIPPQEEKQEVIEDEDNPTVAFVDSEEFFDMLDRQQNPLAGLD